MLLRQKAQGHHGSSCHSGEGLGHPPPFPRRSARLRRAAMLPTSRDIQDAARATEHAQHKGTAKDQPEEPDAQANPANPPDSGPSGGSGTTAEGHSGQSPAQPLPAGTAWDPDAGLRERPGARRQRTKTLRADSETTEEYAINQSDAEPPANSPALPRHSCGDRDVVLQGETQHAAAQGPAPPRAARQGSGCGHLGSSRAGGGPWACPAGHGDHCPQPCPAVADLHGSGCGATRNTAGHGSTGTYTTRTARLRRR